MHLTSWGSGKDDGYECHRESLLPSVVVNNGIRHATGSHTQRERLYLVVSFGKDDSGFFFTLAKFPRPFTSVCDAAMTFLTMRIRKSVPYMPYNDSVTVLNCSFPKKCVGSIFRWEKMILLDDGYFCGVLGDVSTVGRFDRRLAGDLAVLMFGRVGRSLAGGLGAMGRGGRFQSHG